MRMLETLAPSKTSSSRMSPDLTPLTDGLGLVGLDGLPTLEECRELNERGSVEKLLLVLCLATERL